MISRHLLIALADHHQKEAEIAAKVREAVKNVLAYFALSAKLF